MSASTLQAAGPFCRGEDRLFGAGSLHQPGLGVTTCWDLSASHVALYCRLAGATLPSASLTALLLLRLER